MTRVSDRSPPHASRARFTILLIPLLLMGAITVLALGAIAAEEPWSSDWSSKTASSVIPGGIYLAGSPEPCLGANEGALRYAPKHKALILCDGTQWRAVQTVPLGGETAP